MIAERTGASRARLDGVLGVEDVTATAGVVATDRIAELDCLRASGEDLLVLGNVLLRPGDVKGMLFTRWHEFSMAIDMLGPERDWKLFGAREWYRKRAPAECDRSRREAVRNASQCRREAGRLRRLSRIRAGAAGRRGSDREPDRGRRGDPATGP